METKHACPITDIRLAFDMSAAPASKKSFFTYEVAHVQDDLGRSDGNSFYHDERVRELSLTLRIEKKGLSFRIFNPAVILGSTVADFSIPMRELPRDAFQSYKTIARGTQNMSTYETLRAQHHSAMVDGLIEKAREKGLDISHSRDMNYALRKTISLWFDAFVKPDVP